MDRMVEMSDEETIIHIQWTGPHTFEDAKRSNGPTDYGVDQIYGGHPVYGTSVLLYIGRAMQQKFGKRISQEVWWPYNNDVGRVEVYVGRLSGYNQTLDAAKWNKHIELCERLLIYAHAPAANAQTNLAALERDLWYLHVLNWGLHRDLLPEVSGARWTTRFGSNEGYRQFDATLMPDAAE